MDTLLVTGGAGFIGANFVHHVLAGDRWRVVNLDCLTYAANPASLAGLDEQRHRLVEADIGDRDAVRALLAGEKPAAIVHFAAESHVDRSIDDPGAFIRTNVQGTQVLLDAALEHWRAGHDGFRFLHVSTDEVYGDLGPDDPAFTETTPYRPSSPYAASKAASDHLVRAWHRTYGLPVLVTNCSNNYGPRQFPEKLIPLMLINALEGKDLPVYGDGQQRRDWLFVEDHCRAIERVLEAGRPGRTYNVGGNAERTNLDVVHALCDLLDERRPGERPRREQVRFVDDRPGHDRRYAIDASRIAAELDWHPSVDFETGLARTVDWYLEHEAWWQPLRKDAYRGERLGTRDGAAA
ncbi:dTDP-glucose 4,6-dehydratase [Wenzhouxiangella sp. XN79A]|uniref:dTDP-glucose 4,6-dehydratase n=1 Tax=Wenzhouxiangella sp. XN79A TaxID=2724193 RepID=UPI00144AD0EF|nr:dTDP-glucose 4,6-dehydratase [Wenzhouxiangella sp. XN79A]NKI35942.1 dTDP-glucose 4,6-dehydratase [Wenzhouxiangella sp. XN79A]